MKTYSAKPSEVEKTWWVIDAEGAALGRLATTVAKLLRGKHKPIFTPHIDTGDHVIIVNAEKVRLTGKKREQKVYHRHTGHPGGVKSPTAEFILSGPHPERVIEKAVSAMLTKSKLRERMMTRLKVYKGSEHPHGAQQPQALALS